jgi:hypothetical protein
VEQIVYRRAALAARAGAAITAASLLILSLGAEAQSAAAPAAKPAVSKPAPAKAASTAAVSKTSAPATTPRAAAAAPARGPAPMPSTAPECAGSPKYPLPLPSSLSQKDFINFDQTLLAFVNCGNYLGLGWKHDKRIRDTGPYLKGTFYGTHPSVMIYYSPQVITWLKNGRKGAISDGAMIIKEQLSPPAARYEGKGYVKPSDWTVMIKDSKGSKDGWYWSEVYTPGMPVQATASFKPPFTYPNGGFGHYCLNCHASAEKEHTYSALNNIEGFPGDPISFRVDESWRDIPAQLKPFTGQHSKAKAIAHAKAGVTPVEAPNSDFLTTFKSIGAVPYGDVQKMVPETYDRIVSSMKGPGEFLSSDQCLGCHAAVSGNQPTMFIQTAAGANGINVSPYGEWRWSPMGLAGRDPIFHAQLESELAYIRSIPDKKTSQSLEDTAINTCFRCHGVMGKRQWDIDTKCDPTNPVKPCNPADPKRPQFKPEFLQVDDFKNPHFKYGALARDGVSCLSCHRQQETRQPPGGKENSLKYFLEHSITGLFQTGDAKRIVGPFKDVATYPMETALGITPKHDEYIQSSRMCGSCHTIYLPVIDKPPIEPVSSKTHFNMEQATYLEWLNSKFQNEIKPFAACDPKEKGPQACAQSCQNCHMPGAYHNKAKNISIDPIQTKFAVIEDQDYPQADHRAPLDKINVRFRETGFKRHELVGMNVFLLEMFKQNNNVLGVGLADYMSGSTTDLSDAIDNMVMQARSKTATIQTTIQSATADKLVADVKVTNLAGHRLPSGVGFRRAFIEFMVIDNGGSQPRAVWSSGRTNKVGVIVDDAGKPLPSEFFEEYTDKDGKKKQHFQQHYNVITSPGQVQIYEELTQNADGKFTTSFLRRDHDDIKDNRLLPQGWTKAGPDPKNFTGVYLEATYPRGLAASDASYMDGSGSDTVRYEVALPKGLDPKNLSVRATLYYQSIPPYFLNMRFKEVPDGPATKRLYYLASNLKTDGTAIQDWKLMVTGTETKVAQ